MIPIQEDMVQSYFLEYIWQGGAGEFRSKVKIVPSKRTIQEVVTDHLKETWNYDGSSTGQATTESSQVDLKPVAAYYSRKRPEKAYILCSSKEREEFMKAAEKETALNFWFGFEQEFFICDLETSAPIGFYPGIPEQGPYYCGVEAVSNYNLAAQKSSRTFYQVGELTDAIAKEACDLDIFLTGYNLEVAPGQTEIQVMGTGVNACDDLMMLRFLAHRVLLQYKCKPVFDPKPLGPDWNGSGLHTNVSTAAMRAPGGLQVILETMKPLADSHAAHLAVYGAENEKRLTGKHETSSMDHFTWSFGGRHTSVRIPNQVRDKGCGYFEDRRPAANANPYLVAAQIVKTLVP